MEVNLIGKKTNGGGRNLKQTGTLVKDLIHT